MIGCETMSKAILEVHNVGMRFRMSREKITSLKDYILKSIKREIEYKEFRALDHISFTAEKGDRIGILGLNGAGKSTLLKIIAGVYLPTEGTVIKRGKIIPLLELGAGFENQYTGRENIFLYGSFLGYSKEFIESKYQEIVDFAELEGFMEEKVKNFSSGMVSRLGFSIATVAGAAEILILDEVLSVGDEFFRKKSLARIKELIHGGSTVLMVSHGMQTILDNCTKVVWIEQGNMRMIGEPKTVCKAYRSQYSE